MLKISDSTKSQRAIGLNQTLNKQAESTSINNIAITSPSNNISQLKSTDVNNTNSEVGIKTLDNELPFQLKSGIEQLSGISMGDVKVHHNSDKPAQLQAHAYAQGTDIHLAKGQESDDVSTVTSYFDPVWNAFSKHTDGSMQWIPKQIVAIGEDFHSQVGDGKVRTTLYKVRWEGYDKKDDTWEPITHLQGYATMVKSFK